MAALPQSSALGGGAVTGQLVYCSHYACEDAQVRAQLLLAAKDHFLTPEAADVSGKLLMRATDYKRHERQLAPLTNLDAPLVQHFRQ